MHASNDPEFFNKRNIDYIVMGLGKASAAFVGWLLF